MEARLGAASHLATATPARPIAPLAIPMTRPTPTTRRPASAAVAPAAVSVSLGPVAWPAWPAEVSVDAPCPAPSPHADRGRADPRRPGGAVGGSGDRPLRAAHR